jgi:hypothetical protein
MLLWILVKKVSGQSNPAGFLRGELWPLPGKPGRPSVEGIPGAAEPASFAEGRGRRPSAAGFASAGPVGRVSSQETITAWSQRAVYFQTARGTDSRQGMLGSIRLG